MQLNRDRASLAARNNAEWCDAVCRAHGVPGEFHDGIWLTRGPAPHFYPNAVTLTGAQDATRQIRQVQDLLASLPADVAVKDSFCALDLAPLRFRILFEAAWIWQPADAEMPAPEIPNVRWSSVESPDQLAEWEAAWNGGAAPSAGVRTFPPSLLDEPDIAFISGTRSSRIVAGAIANRTAGCVGISNVFAPAQTPALFRSACVARIMETFPGLPLVGYESGPALSESLAAGFERAGPLRVWIKERPPSRQLRAAACGPPEYRRIPYDAAARRAARYETELRASH